ncbi:hypothetical protein HN51_015087 [Arachis hypogaea]|uniref:SAM domain-containing protein n=1 Tax=Arachis hypogaea TaxID=3818 RepID=A0A445CM12_ARAHY|nr:uncharacterized protein LOC112695915 [Arachis hypogaea]XP_025604237.1 uncharacterized protein LOC112695915 [Arachis hypogaea]QHO44913.1 uncharacterized protein DS421_6g174760 [Arachis hypogaea]QHO44914.1 uncharacterized protein DS421_6g174760 [Arachis hypogaea]RYR51981.1 hypothetical protein Ahy_A06g026918 [Arachis hypogaea]
MAKTKASRTGKVPGKKGGTSHSPDSDNQHVDGDWIIVKKQIVNILVSAAPCSKRNLMASPGPKDMHPMPPETASNHMQLPMETSTVYPSGNEPENTSLLTAPKEILDVRSGPPSIPKATSVKQPRVVNRINSQNPHQVSLMKSPKLLGLSNTSKAIKQPRTFLAPRRSCNLVISLNQGLRASNLERKLERAGGLTQWLTSLGLGQFVRIFQGKSLNKYQLVNLTMKKLKDMGANAVGPRRKLIHAIDCVCQPYCFEAL